MRKLLLLLVGMIFLSSGVFASDINVDFSSEQVIRGVENSIQMTLTAANVTPGNYNLYTLSDMIITPLDIFNVNGTYFQKTFELTPRESLDVSGNYAFTYVLNHRGVEKFEYRKVIEFVDLEDVIEIGSDAIDPSSGQISFYVENLGNSSIKNLTASFSSVLFDAEKTFSIEAGEKKEIFVYADVEQLKKTKAGVYIIEGVFETSYGDVKINGNLYLGEKKGITSTEDKSGLLVRTQTITKVNAGNVVEDVMTEMTGDIFSRFFTSFNIEPSLVERNGFRILYTWEKDRLEPTEAFVVKAKVNYFLPFLILVFLILGILVVKKYTDMKVEVKKTVKPIKTRSGEFALRIELQVKARTNVENVKLTDRVPAMVKLYNKFGSNSPDKIDSRTRRLTWNVGDLFPGEVRLFHYIVYSKVGIVGKFILPEAKVVFEKDEKAGEAPSNRVYFMNEQSDK